MIPNIECLIRACTLLGVPYRFLDENRNFVEVGENRKMYFANAVTPFNTEDVARICKDKQFSYQLLQDVIRVPRTKGYLTPNAPLESKKYLSLFSVDEIMNDIEKTFEYPLIMKPNAGATGQNVRLCKNRKEGLQALRRVFNREIKGHDYIALAQEYIQIRREFRVVVLYGTLNFAYEKDISQARFAGNLSPLHFENAKANLLTEKSLIEGLRAFIAPIFEKIPLGFGGLDVALDQDNNLWLIELNSHPGFRAYIRDNGEKEVIGLYAAALEGASLTKK